MPNSENLHLEDIMETIYEFCDHLLTSADLDKEINNTCCLKLLYVLLNIKNRKILNKECDKMELSVYKVYEQDSDNIFLQCEVLKLALLIAKNPAEEMENIIKYINSVIKNSNLTNLASLKVVHILKEIYIKNKNLEKYGLDYINEFLFHNLIQKESPLRIYILSCVLSDYLNSLNAQKQINFTQEIFVHCKFIKNLEILCSVCSDTNIISTLIKNKNSVLYKDEFWIFLGNSLTCFENNSLQKQATFLLELFIDLYHDKDSFGFDDAIPFIKVDNMSQQESKKIWQNFFVLLKMLKETQVHLLMPSLQLLKSIKHLKHFWQKCIYQMLLNHSHSSIISFFIINYILQENIIFPELFHNFLSNINSLDYSNLSLSTLEKIPLYCNNLDNKNFSAFLRDMSQISWTPTSMWYFFKSLFSYKLQQKISLLHFKPIYELILKTPHVYIRNGCAKIFVSYFLSIYDWKDSADCIFKMLIIVKHYNEDLFVNVVKTNFDLHFIQNLAQVKQLISKNNVECFDVFVQIVTITKAQEMQNFFVKNMESFDDDLLVIICANNLDSFSKRDMENVIENIDNISYYAMNSALAIINNLMKHNDFRQRFFEKTVNVLREPCMYSRNVVYIALYVSIHFFSTSDAIKNILNKWIDSKFLSNPKFDSYIWIIFYELYFLIVENCDISVLEYLYSSENNFVIAKVFKNFVEVAAPKNSTNIHTFLEISLNILPYLTKSKYLREFCQSYSACLFSTNCSKKDFQTRNLFKKSLNTLLQYGEIYPFVNYYLSLNIKNVINQIECNNNYYWNILIVTIVEIQLKGIIIKKEEKLEYNVCQDIHEKLEAEKNNPNIKNVITRLNSLESMLHIIEKRVELADSFASCLIEKYKLYFNKRYFPDSQAHLHKLRIIQALVMIHPFINNQRQPLIELIMDSFCIEIHQPCVKLFMQWLLFFLLKAEDNAISVLVDRIESTTKTQPSTVAAFILVLLYVTFTKTEPFWCSAVEALLPWCMGPHFKLRVHSQMAVKILHNEAKRRSYKDFGMKYGFLEKSVEFVIAASGKALQDTLKADEIIYNNFNPERDYSLHTILFDIPRLYNITPNEWQNIPIYEFTYQGIVPVKNTDKTFERSITDNRDIKKIETENYYETFSESNFCNIQRKITPWKILMEETEDKPLGDFILIASLIDKPTNLGGLSRTCEVFGVKQLVLSDCKIMKDKNFVGLSMTSENWLECIEVKVLGLKEFILELRRKGYCIIGAEQTSDSTDLDKYKFNKKTALLLGNEKEGIPPDLISVLDACVEIPQLGLVRSLNVHVAGATFIWEYAKQHLIR